MQTTFVDINNIIQTLHSKIFINETCYLKLEKLINNLCVNGEGSMVFVLGDQENEWKQIYHELIKYGNRIKGELNEKTLTTFMSCDEEPLLYSDDSSDDDNVNLIVNRPSQSKQSNKNESTTIPGYDLPYNGINDQTIVSHQNLHDNLNTNKEIISEANSDSDSVIIAYINISAHVVRDQKTFFKEISEQLWTLYGVKLFKQKMGDVNFTMFAQSVSIQKRYRVVIFIDDLYAFLDTNNTLFYEISDSFLTTDGSNHILVIFSAISDEFVTDKKFLSRITFSQEPLKLKRPRNVEETTELFYEMTYIPSYPLWNQSIRQKYTVDTFQQFYQLFITIQPLRDVAIHLLLSYIDELKISDTVVGDITDPLSLFVDQQNYCLTPYQFIFLAGIVRLKTITNERKCTLDDLCNFLYANSEGIPFSGVKDSFHEVKEYHTHTLKELQRLGLVKVFAGSRQRKVQLMITDKTFYDILKSLKTQQPFEDLVKWSESLWLVFKK
ncbi:Origin recognition complex subunit 3 [Entamoeba marina]